MAKTAKGKKRGRLQQVRAAVGLREKVRQVVAYITRWRPLTPWNRRS